MLYLVGTPIGNLEDLSYRQAQTLSSVDIILAEDTRSAQNLLHAIAHLFSFKVNPKQQIVSYYKDKEFEKLPQVFEWLKEEKNIALISEAGMPIISDPGYLLLKTAIKEEIPYTIIPGPSAVTTALLHSGLKFDNFMFIGYLPKKSSHLRKLISSLASIRKELSDTVFIAFESPHRIYKTLEVLHEVIPENEIVVARELTKKFEEIKRGKAEELMNYEYKGEITIVF